MPACAQDCDANSQDGIHKCRFYCVCLLFGGVFSFKFKGRVCAINAKPCVCNSDNYSGREAPSLKMGSDFFFFTIFGGSTSGLYADWLACHQ